MTTIYLDPWFLPGHMTHSQWQKEERHLPAPWMEVEFPGKLIVTVPSDLFRVSDDPRPFFSVFDKGMDVVGQLAGMTQGRYRTERFVYDIQCLVGALARQAHVTCR